MTLIKVTHANLSRPVWLVKELIAGFYYSEAHKATHIVSNGGAIFPALESEEELKALLSNNNDKPKEA